MTTLAYGIALPALRGVLAAHPPWLPVISGTRPNLYADFTTEGTSNHYWYLNRKYAGFSAWLTAISGTFSRSSTAYYTNSSGNLAQASSGVIRFDYDPVALTPKGILLEGASTNLCLHSNDFSSAANCWTTQGATTTNQNATGPDGTTSAWTYTSAGDSLTRCFNVSTVGSTALTLSAYAKAGTAGFAFFFIADSTNSTFRGGWFNLTNGTLGTQNVVIAGSPTFTTSGTITPGPNGFYRISMTVNSAMAFGNVYFGFSDADNSLACTTGHTGIGYGGQVENLPFASSYIPTTSGTATRAADSLSHIAFLSTTATLYAKTTTLAFNGGVIVGADSGQAPIFEGTPTNIASYNGTTVLNNSNTINYTGPVKSATAGDGSGRAISANAGTVTSDANALFGGAVTELVVGNRGNIDLAAYGNFIQLGAWPVKATNTQLQTLTT